MAGAARNPLLHGTNFFSEAFESLPGLFYLIDPQGRFLHWNRNFERASGFSPEELSRLTALDLFREPHKGSVAEKIAEVFQNGEASVEAELAAKNGSRAPYFFTGKRVQVDGRPCLVGMGISLAERRQAEAQLRDSEYRHRAILETSLNCIIVIDDRGTIVDFNPAAERSFGVPRAQAIGAPMASLIIPPRLRDAHARGFARFLATGEGPYLGRRVETQALRADGTEFPVELAITPVQSGSKRLFAGSLRDITERKAAEARIDRLNRVYAVLSGINGLIVRVKERKELFEGACRIALDAGKFRMAWIGEVDLQARKIVPAAVAGAETEDLSFLKDQFCLDDGSQANRPLTVRAVLEKTAFFCNDTQSDPRIRYRQRHLENGNRSIAVLPLLVSNQAIGVMLLYSGETDFFDAEEIKLLNELAGDISFALDHIGKAIELDYLAYYDSLTGLANRRLFQERLSQSVAAARRRDSKLALVLADVVHFKSINDSLGRQAGDELLKQLATRLRESAGVGTLARLGADHFALVLPEIKGRSEIGRFVEQIWRACFTAPYLIGGAELRISAKAGIALYPNDGSDAESLLAAAEAALQEAKETAELYQFHTRELTDGVAEELALENRLRQALEQDQFVLHYQPKVDLASGRIVGVEALIRWQSPELGLVPPARFISLMEETGLILPVGAWALEQASRDRGRWAEQGLEAPRVAVNVSSIQLRKRDFVGIVEQAIRRGDALSGIDLEITESLIMEDVKATIAKLERLRRLGVQIAIDDFGTGYSSLGYLAKLPVQSLKIDRSFISGMLLDSSAATLVQTMISLAHSLGLRVVAEGVESEEQAKRLRELRCDEVQGYLYSRPVPFEQVSGLLARSTGTR
ncbi:MAG TPA: EAL domain-containing protein [Burkholderiales bacterium]